MGEETTEPDSTDEPPADDAADAVATPADADSEDVDADAEDVDADADADTDDADADDADAEADADDAAETDAADSSGDAAGADADLGEVPLDAGDAGPVSADDQIEGERDGTGLDRLLWEPIASAALLRTQPRFDDTVLDAWCGDGAAALPTAALVGPGGRVDAIDPDETLVAAARARAAGQLPQLHVHAADPGEWATSGYDLVQCVLGLASCGTPDATVRHLASLVKPGGRLVISLWAQGALAPLVELAREAIAADESAAAVTLPGTAGTLAALMHDLGLVEVRAEHVDRHLELTADLAWQLVVGTRRRSADRLEALDLLDEDALARVKQRFDAAVARAGVTRVDVSTLIAVGRRPVA